MPLRYGSIGVSGDRPVATAATNISAAGAKSAGYFWDNVAVESWYGEEGAADYTQGEFSRTGDIVSLKFPNDFHQGGIIAYVHNASGNNL